jgi:cupin superfamily acireductone dioxygenase involved in methionine salvage
MKRLIIKTLFLFVLFISFSLQNSTTQIHVPISKTQEEFVFATILADTGNSHMLWAHPENGWAHLWTLNPGLGIASTKGFAMGAGWWVVCYHRNPDGTSQLLWAHPVNGWAHLWTLNENLGIVSTKGFAMAPGWWATSYHKNSDGNGFLLWTLPGNGLAHLWTLNTSLRIASTKGFSMTPGWWAISYHRNADETSQLLWTLPGNGLAHLWTLSTSLGIASTRGFAMAANWWATSYHRNADGTSQLLWTHPGNGLAHLWMLNITLGIASTRGYLMGPNWWAYGFNGSPPATDNDVTLSANPTSGRQGATVTVTIGVKGNLQPISAFGMDLTYNGTMFQFESSSKGTLTGNWELVNANSPSTGLAKVGGVAFSGTPIPVGSTGSVIVVRLRVTGDTLNNGDVSAIRLAAFTDDFVGMGVPNARWFTLIK